MDGKITVNQILFTLILGGLAALWGISDKGSEVEANPNIIIEPPTTEPNDVPVVEWETIVMNVSAYCPCEICCEDFADGITASGHKIQKGDKFAAAPRKYPFGTEMIIPGYAGDKVVEVKDVGGAIKGNRLDIYFDTHGEALEFGRRKEHPVKVRINKLPEK